MRRVIPHVEAALNQGRGSAQPSERVRAGQDGERGWLCLSATKSTGCHLGGTEASFNQNCRDVVDCSVRFLYNRASFTPKLRNQRFRAPAKDLGFREFHEGQARGRRIWTPGGLGCRCHSRSAPRNKTSRHGDCRCSCDSHRAVGGAGAEVRSSRPGIGSHVGLFSGRDRLRAVLLLGVRPVTAR